MSYRIEIDKFLRDERLEAAEEIRGKSPHATEGIQKHCELFRFEEIFQLAGTTERESKEETRSKKTRKTKKEGTTKKKPTERRTIGRCTVAIESKDSEPPVLLLDEGDCRVRSHSQTKKQKYRTTSVRVTRLIERKNFIPENC